MYLKNKTAQIAKQNIIKYYFPDMNSEIILETFEKDVYKRQALYGFKQSEGKRNVNRGRLKGNDLTKYQIYDTVKAGIRHRCV